MTPRLAELRKSKGLNQKDLADLLDVNQNTVSRWENGQREIDYANLEKLALYFDVSIDYLLGRDIAPAPQYPEHVIALAQQIKDLTPEQREIIEKQLILFASMDKK